MFRLGHVKRASLGYQALSCHEIKATRLGRDDVFFARNCRAYRWPAELIDRVIGDQQRGSERVQTHCKINRIYQGRSSVSKNRSSFFLPFLSRRFFFIRCRFSGSPIIRYFILFFFFFIISVIFNPDVSIVGKSNFRWELRNTLMFSASCFYHIFDSRLQLDRVHDAYKCTWKIVDHVTWPCIRISRVSFHRCQGYKRIFCNHARTHAVIFTSKFILIFALFTFISPIIIAVP